MPEQTTVPPIVGVAEAAAMAGITRNHFAQLRTRGQVPEPQVVLACGPIWKRSVIAKWIEERLVLRVEREVLDKAGE